MFTLRMLIWYYIFLIFKLICIHNIYLCVPTMYTPRIPKFLQAAYWVPEIVPCTREYREREPGNYGPFYAWHLCYIFLLVSKSFCWYTINSPIVKLLATYNLTIYLLNPIFFGGLQISECHKLIPKDFLINSYHEFLSYCFICCSINACYTPAWISSKADNKSKISDMAMELMNDIKHVKNKSSVQ